MHKSIFTFFIFIIVATLSAEASNMLSENIEEEIATVKGQVVSNGNQELSFATVYLKENNIACSADEHGNFVLQAPHGSYTLCVSMVGFETVEKPITVEESSTEIKVTLSESTRQIGMVEVKGQSMVSRINSTAYNVEAIDATLLHNTTLSVAQALDRVSGVNIRSTGGVGSDNNISLNGFSGNHVKIFIDGIPMQGSGSSMDLAKMPIGMAERIEVYKGVVPIEFGSDALGGVINIVTRNTNKTFLDASYSYGSFNTHKSNVSFGENYDNGLLFQVNAYQNYSDNDYEVLTQSLDLETNVYSADSSWYKRFHDTYHNEAVVARFGVANKPWATRLFIEGTYSQENKDIQNSNLMQVVFGGKETKSQTVIPAFNYLLKDMFVDNLDFSLSGRYNFVESQNIDTMARRYNWEGEWV